MRNKMRNKKPKPSKYTIRFLDSTNRSVLFLWQVAGGYAFVSDDYEVQGDTEFMSYPDNAGIGDADRTPPWLFDFGGLKRYPPLKNPTLHRTFGELEDSEVAITSFASKYGLLGKPVVLHHKGSKGSSTTGESLARWRTEILQMGLSLAIWDLIQDKNTRELNKIIEWPRSDFVTAGVISKREDGHYRFFDWDTHSKTGAGVVYKLGSPVADRRSLPELLQRWRQGDVLEPALFYLCQIIEGKCKGKVDLRLLLARAPMSLAFYMAPDSLLTAMWLMFMWEVTGDIKVFWCPGCGQWKERFDARQQTCSHACKQRMYRNNLQKRGIEHKQGQEGGTK